jgi:hypothetical protein
MRCNRHPLSHGKQSIRVIDWDRSSPTTGNPGQQWGVLPMLAGSDRDKLMAVVQTKSVLSHQKGKEDQNV